MPWLLAGSRQHVVYTRSMCSCQETLPFRRSHAVTLFVVLVPARRFFFNQNATILAGTVVVVGTLALILG